MSCIGISYDDALDNIKDAFNEAVKKGNVFDDILKGVPTSKKTAAEQAWVDEDRYGSINIHVETTEGNHFSFMYKQGNEYIPNDLGGEGDDLYDVTGWVYICPNCKCKLVEDVDEKGFTVYSCCSDKKVFTEQHVKKKCRLEADDWEFNQERATCYIGNPLNELIPSLVSAKWEKVDV